MNRARGSSWSVRACASPPSPPSARAPFKQSEVSLGSSSQRLRRRPQFRKLFAEREEHDDDVPTGHGDILTVGKGRKRAPFKWHAQPSSAHSRSLILCAMQEICFETELVYASFHMHVVSKSDVTRLCSLLATIVCSYCDTLGD